MKNQPTKTIACAFATSLAFFTLTACGPKYSARTFILPQVNLDDNFTLDSTARTYLTDIGFFSSGGFAPGKDGSHYQTKGYRTGNIFIIVADVIGGEETHVFAGLDENTDFGPSLTEVAATAHFSGEFIAVYSKESFSSPRLLRDDVYLTADFDAGTLRNTSGRNSRLTVNGSFTPGSRILSGSASVNFAGIRDILTAPLTGRIGQGGAAGTFAGPSKTHAFGGGFSVR